MRPAAWIKVVGILGLAMAFQSRALQDFGSDGGTSVAVFLLVLAASMVAIFIIVAADWVTLQLGWTEGRRSHSLSRHLHNRRLLGQAFHAYTRRAGGLAEPPGGHDPEFLRAWVAGDFFLCERLVEMSGQEAANLAEDHPKSVRHQQYQDAFNRAREAVSRAADIDPRTASILDETD